MRAASTHQIINTQLAHSAGTLPIAGKQDHLNAYVLLHFILHYLFLASGSREAVIRSSQVEVFLCCIRAR